MHFHVPKPLHGWREFAGEVGIIVLGVLIALGAEQLIQTIHSQREVAQFRSAVDLELATTLAAYRYRVDQEPCVKRRLGELRRAAIALQLPDERMEIVEPQRHEQPVTGDTGAIRGPL